METSAESHGYGRCMRNVGLSKLLLRSSRYTKLALTYYTPLPQPILPIATMMWNSLIHTTTCDHARACTITPVSTRSKRFSRLTSKTHTNDWKRWCGWAKLTQHVLCHVTKAMASNVYFYNPPTKRELPTWFAL